LLHLLGDEAELRRRAFVRIYPIEGYGVELVDECQGRGGGIAQGFC
jgi:hypothetical protein